LRDGERDRRRHGLLRRAREGGRRRRPRPRGRGADAPRVQDLPLLRTLRRRPAHLPDEGGGRGVAAARRARALRRAHGARGPGRAREPPPYRHRGGGRGGRRGAGRPGGAAAAARRRRDRRLRERVTAMEREIPMLFAINEALHLAMEADPDVIVLGEDVAGGGGRKDQGIEEAWGGIMGATRGLLKRFGPERVRDTPISEMGFMGAAVGAALTGLRPVAELMFIDFIRDDDPVVFCEPKALMFVSGPVAEGDYTVPLGKAALVREGADVSLVGFGRTVQTALRAAELLARDGVSADVLDLRSLQPLDEEAILATLGKTGRVVVVDQATPRCGIVSDVAALCVDKGFDL